jgi:hypothetical protein
MENHGNILKQLLKTYGYIYGTTWKKSRKKGASFTHMDTDSQCIAQHGISGVDRELAGNFGIS